MSRPFLAYARRYKSQPISEAFVEAIELYRQRRLSAPLTAVLNVDDSASIEPPKSLSVTITAAHPGTILLGGGDQ